MKKIKPSTKNIINLYNLGVDFFQKYDFNQSRSHFLQALELDPHNVSVLLNLATLELTTKNLHKALAYINDAYKLNPKNMDILKTFGSIYFYLEDLDNALILYQKALLINPHDSKILSNIGTYYLYTQNFSEAKKFILKALHINPQEKDALLNLGQLFFLDGNYNDAVHCFQKTLLFYPEDRRASTQLATKHLGLFELKEGWKAWAHREIVRNSSELLEDLPLDLTGKRIIIQYEQGPGDELFFLRFLPSLKKRGAWLAYKPQAKLYNLLTTCNTIDLLIDNDNNLDNIDYTLFIGDLPKLLQIDSVDLIPPALSLNINQHHVETFQIALAHHQGPLLGITWRAGIQRFGHLSKEVPFEELIASIKHLNTNIVVLQRNPSDNEMQLLKNTFGDRLIDASLVNNDLEKMLALLSLLDAYIAVSNTNIHLAASIGKKCHLLVPFPAEWRWGYLENKFSPWYPTFKIYRQHSHHDDWKDALIQLSSDIENELFHGNEALYELDIINELINQKLYNEAELLCENILSIDTANIKALVHLATIFNLTQQYDKLIAVLDKVEKIK